MSQDDFFTLKDQVVLLRVKAKARAREDTVLGVRAGQLVVSVRAPAERGKANAEIARVIAKTLGVSRHDVTLKSGGSSPHKVFQVPLEAADALRRIAFEAHGP
jgi:uncharacterized protein (TIGR00251 family)